MLGSIKFSISKDNFIIKKYTTPTDKSPISYLKFNDQGDHIFSATESSLKIWTFFEDETLLVDNIETQWNKLQDFKISNNEINCNLLLIKTCKLSEIK